MQESKPQVLLGFSAVIIDFKSIRDWDLKFIVFTGELLVSGWGKLEDQGANPDVLQKVELPVVDDEACQAAYEELGDEIHESFICAGIVGVGGKDACQGTTLK